MMAIHYRSQTSLWRKTRRFHNLHIYMSLLLFGSWVEMSKRVQWNQVSALLETMDSKFLHPHSHLLNHRVHYYLTLVNSYVLLVMNCTPKTLNSYRVVMQHRIIIESPSCYRNTASKFKSTQGCLSSYISLRKLGDSNLFAFANCQVASCDAQYF